MADAVRTTRVRIEGRVQGVGYRLWTQRTAVAMGVRGWVRNLRDGSVEALFQGADRDVSVMIARCKDGPPGSAVVRVEVLSEDGAGIFAGFDVRETA